MLALLFPGLGSQSPTDRAVAEGFAPELLELAGELLGVDPFDRMADSARYSLTTLFITSQAAWRAAGSPVADVYAGHSVGELGALVAAGAIDAAAALAKLVEGATLIAQAPPGAMVAVRTGAERAAELVAPFEGWVVANDNAPEQVVLAGPAGAVAGVVEAAERRGVRAMLLPVNGAFHSPLLTAATDAFTRRLVGTVFAPTAAPVFCCASAAPFVDPAAEFGASLSRPVRWRELLLQLDAAGVTRYADVGPGQLVSGLVRRTLPHAERLTLAAAEVRATA